MSKEEVAAIMSLAKKIIEHEENKEYWDMIDNNIDERDYKESYQEYKKSEHSDLKTIRKSEDAHDNFVQPRVGNCECCDD